MSSQESAANYVLTEEELTIALGQVGFIDEYAAARNNGAGFSPRVCLPPRKAGENEKWVAIDPLTHQVNADIPQPDPNRTVLYPDCGYCYTDKLGPCIKAAIVSTVIFSILTTPIILLCCIPMIKKMKQVNIYFLRHRVVFTLV